MATNKGADDLHSRSHGALGGVKSIKAWNRAKRRLAPGDRTGAFRSLGRRILIAILGIFVLLTGYSSQTSAQTDLTPHSSGFVRDLSLRRQAPDLAAWILVVNSSDPGDYEVYQQLFPDSPLAPMARLMAAHHQSARLDASPADRLHLESLKTKSLALVRALRRQGNTDGLRRQRDRGFADPATADTSLGKLPTLAVGLIVEAAGKPKGAGEDGEVTNTPAYEAEVTSPGTGIIASLRQVLARAKAKTGVLLMHLLGLALGLGAATVLDLLIAKSLYGGRLTKEEYKFIAFASKIVCFGLALLWISGVSFLLHYLYANPAGLENPKVWAKVSIVAVLTLNGLYIHKVVLPELKRNAGFSVFHRTPQFKRSMILVSGAVSLVSWYTPLVLGAAGELNFAVSTQALLLGYCLMLSLAILGTHLLFYLLTARLGDQQQGDGSRNDGMIVQPPRCVEIQSRRFIRKIDGPFAVPPSDSVVEPGLNLRLPSRKAS